MARKKFSEFAPKNAPAANSSGVFVVGVDETLDTNFKISVPELISLANQSGIHYTELPVSSITGYTVVHNFGRIPFVQCIDLSGQQIYPLIVHPSNTSFEVTFSPAFSGTIIYM